MKTGLLLAGLRINFNQRAPLAGFKTPCVAVWGRSGLIRNDRMDKGIASIGEEMSVRIVVREIWALFVLLGEALFRRNSSFLWQ